jgi:thiamine-phosphate diphosphorylase
VNLPSPPLLVISDRSQARLPLLEVAAAAFKGGCRWFSLREKSLPAAGRLALLAELVSMGRAYGAAVMAHEDIEIVIAAGAGGVHLPSGADPAAARARLPRGLIGASVHGAGEAAALLATGTDYVTISPIFLTDSKPGDPETTVRALVEAITAADGIAGSADYIVIGAGSAGCVVASRLSEDGSKVVLLEAGPPDRDPWIHIPAGVLRVLNNTKINWNYLSEGEEGTDGRQLQWPRGKTWAAPARSTACSMSAAIRPITTAGRRWAAAAGAMTRCCRSSKSRRPIAATATPNSAARAAR